MTRPDPAEAGPGRGGESSRSTLPTQCDTPRQPADGRRYIHAKEFRRLAPALGDVARTLRRQRQGRAADIVMVFLELLNKSQVPVLTDTQTQIFELAGLIERDPVTGKLPKPQSRHRRYWKDAVSAIEEAGIFEVQRRRDRPGPGGPFYQYKWNAELTPARGGQSATSMSRTKGVDGGPPKGSTRSPQGSVRVTPAPRTSPWSDPGRCEPIPNYPSAKETLAGMRLDDAVGGVLEPASALRRAREAAYATQSLDTTTPARSGGG